MSQANYQDAFKTLKDFKITDIKKGKFFSLPALEKNLVQKKITKELCDQGTTWFASRNHVNKFLDSWRRLSQLQLLYEGWEKAEMPLAHIKG